MKSGNQGRLEKLKQWKIRTFTFSQYWQWIRPWAIFFFFWDYI